MPKVTLCLCSAEHPVVVNSTAQNRPTLHDYGTPLCIIPMGSFNSSGIKYIVSEWNYWHLVSCCQKESSKTIIRFFIGKPLGYCFQRDKKFNLITEIICPKRFIICSTAEQGKYLSPAVAAQWIRTVNLPALHRWIHHQSPKLSSQIKIEENGVIWKDIERARWTALWARHQDHWKEKKEWRLALREHTEHSCRVPPGELWTGSTLLLSNAPCPSSLYLAKY